MQFNQQSARSLFAYSQKIRRDIHKHPELGFQETRTASLVSSELLKMGIEVSEGVGKTGVVGLLRGKENGKVILMRFDMDALPITEETGAEYSSVNSGVMHACGHDGHVAIGLTVAKLLSDIRESFHGTIKFVFQPAEEGLGGAERMIADGVLENPKPEITLSGHLWNSQPVGWFAITPGPVMAESKTFKIVLTGRGGHGAKPHETIDPIMAAGQLISALQSIVSRNVDPTKTAVVSVTSIHSGTTFNVIPQTAELQGTIRFFDYNIGKIVMTRFFELCKSIAKAFNCELEIILDDITPALVNDHAGTAIVQNVAKGIFPDAIIDDAFQTMGSEDMAFMMEKIPGCFIMIGSANPTRGLVADHHHPKFDFDEEALTIGATLLTSAALNLLK